MGDRIAVGAGAVVVLVLCVAELRLLFLRPRTAPLPPGLCLAAPPTLGMPTAAADSIGIDIGRSFVFIILCCLMEQPRAPYAFVIVRDLTVMYDIDQAPLMAVRYGGALSLIAER